MNAKGYNGIFTDAATAVWAAGSGANSGANTGA
jgi:hypothetical protein